MTTVVVGMDALSPRPSGAAVTVGTFDGVHLGHRALIARTLEIAAARGLETVVITWDRHPLQTLRPAAVPPLLTSPERKVELLTAAGPETLAILPFDAGLSSWPAERFVTEILRARLNARAVVVGRGWRFGRGAIGDVDLLTEMGSAEGFSTAAFDLVEAAGGPISSSRIRELVATGDVEGAAGLLGRRYDFDGIVVKGEGRGTGLGYPTANLDVDLSLARPGRGVYAGRARVDGDWYPAAVNAGHNPQFGGDGAGALKIEPYLLDFEEDLYGRSLRIELWKRLRDERKFPSVDALVAQMGKDVAATRALVC
jgi:riboflavin kinase/FMN adenylyltransferase